MKQSGSCHLGDFFSSRREKGVAGLPTLSVTLNDGLVKREDLDRKQDTNLAPEDHLLVRPGDIAYNMMRMWQGAFGLADQEGLVSPAYVVLKPKEGTNSKYASYLFKTKRMAYLFRAYSYGLTDDRLRLYFNDFRRIPVTLPSLEKQTAYAEAIATWDDAIEVAKPLVEVTGVIRKALVSELASGVRRVGSFSGPWMECRLGDICSFSRGYAYDSGTYAEAISPNAFLTLKSVEKGGGFNSYGLKFLTNKVDERFSVKPGDLLCAITDVTREAPVVGAPLLVPENLSAYDQVSFSMDLVSLLVSSDIQKVFLYFFLQTPEVRRRARALASGSTVLHLDLNGYKKVKIRFPEQVDEQNQIVRMLLAAEANERLARRHLTALQAERQALLQSLCATRSFTAAHAFEKEMARG